MLDIFMAELRLIFVFDQMEKSEQEEIKILVLNSFWMVVEEDHGCLL